MLGDVNWLQCPCNALRVAWMHYTTLHCAACAMPDRRSTHAAYSREDNSRAFTSSSWRGGRLMMGWPSIVLCLVRRSTTPCIAPGLQHRQGWLEIRERFRSSSSSSREQQSSSVE